MEEAGNSNKNPSVINATSTPDSSPKTKPKPRGKKRKRIESESGSESDSGLPENAFEVEKNVIASAVKNNLDDVSVKKILKKVVTNDHVLALVKLREEEEASTEESKHIPKLTRSKVKELTKVSPKSAPWNLQNLELTPIKHIPVKTRPEVKALIAQELPEDEDDEEYEPTHDEVQSDDDQGLESCSDLDSQPRTPATPRSQQKDSPVVVKDGPFKVPQDVSTPTRRKLQLEEEEATIALRTRSKLCLSETPIEHIESSFVPPDALPAPADDHLWNDFLSECLNPAGGDEEDDETDPEYNVAADPDAPDEDDEDALERSIIKISKKELNDLVTELFNIMPEASVDETLANMANGVLDDTDNQTPPRWEGKQEPASEDESSVKMVDRIVFEPRSTISKPSVGKMEPDDAFDDYDVTEEPALLKRREKEKEDEQPRGTKEVPSLVPRLPLITPVKIVNVVDIRIEEQAGAGSGSGAGSGLPRLAPAPVRQLQPRNNTHKLQVTLDSQNVILPEQTLILQQQLRMHIQLATSNFLQLFVHPVHWSYGPTYKEYLEALVKIAQANPKSVVSVCNLQPAMELCDTWEKTVSADTPENKKMVQFIQAQADRCQRRIASNNFYAGEFHETLYRTVANSCVFLYPHLLPAMPYRAVPSRRFQYQRSEDSLIALGLDQFWDYVDNNPSLFAKPAKFNPRHRWGYGSTVELVAKYMFPWISYKVLMGHITKIRRAGDKDNPITKFFTDRSVEPVKHKLLPFNQQLTLYEQPEHEMPRLWLRYLAKTSKRFKHFLHRNRSMRANFVGEEPTGVEINPGLEAKQPLKAPLPIDFTKKISHQRINIHPPEIKQADKFDLQIQPPTEASSFYQLVTTSKGVNLVPLKMLQTLPIEHDKSVPEARIVPNSNTVTVDCNIAPISSSVEVRKDLFEKTTEATNVIENVDPDHCKCCVLLRSIVDKQKVITDYFSSSRKKSEPCRCRERRSPKISNRLRLLVDRYKRRSECIYRDLMKKLDPDKDKENGRIHSDCDSDIDRRNAEDMEIARDYQMRLTYRSSFTQNLYIKKKIHALFSKFDPEVDDPVMLAHQLETSFKVEMVDMHKEFMGFLTAEQADRIDRFRDYFVLACVGDLVEKVEEEVKDEAVKKSILKLIASFFSGSWSACGMCAALLAAARGHRRLARYAFRLFPHWSQRRKPEPAEPTSAPAVVPQEPEPMEEDPADKTLTNADGTLTAPDYEADNSSSGEEESDPGSILTAPSQGEVTVSNIKIEFSLDNSEEHSQPVPCKNEPADDSSDMSMMIMSEDEPVTSDPPEWKREEDKVILEHVLKVNLAPQEGKQKTVMEIFEEKKVLEVLAQCLPNKSMEALKERIFYLLNVLLASKMTSQ